MKIWHLVIFLIGLAFVSLETSAQSSDATLASTSLRDADDPLMVSKTFWLSEMRQKLPKEFCASDDEAMLCYPVSETDCKNLVVASFPSCLNSIALPDRFNAEVEGVSAAIKVGECTFKKFFEAYGKKRKDIDGCKIRREAP